MKKTSLTLVVLTLIVVVAHAAADRVQITKRRNARNLLMRDVLPRAESGELEACIAFTCSEKGETCSNEDNNTRYCKDSMNCIDGLCETYRDGTQCYNFSCPTEDNTLYCNASYGKCQVRKGEGESCGLYEDECREGFFCNETQVVPRVCLPNPTRINDPCPTPTPTDLCPTGSVCSGGICKSYPTSLGAACYPEVGCNSSALDCRNDTCRELPKRGEECPNGRCAPGLYCRNFDKLCYDLPGKDELCGNEEYCAEGLHCNKFNRCIPPSGVGGECVSDEGCKDNLYCLGSQKCSKTLPGNNDECRPVEPLCAAGLYCNVDNICSRYSVEGERCRNRICADGLFCNKTADVCAKYPGLGEACVDRKCREGFACFVNDTKEGTCVSNVSGEGGYCSDEISCGRGLVCDADRNECVAGECFDDYDCPNGKGCLNLTCVKFMSLDDGAECVDRAFGFLLCKEGSGCLPNNASSTNYSCRKIYTKLSDEIDCFNSTNTTNGTDDTRTYACPDDSFCECNTLTGKNQCVPYPDSRAKMVEYYMKYLEAEDEESELPYIMAIRSVYKPFEKDTRCTTPVPIPDSGSPSKTKPSSFCLSVGLSVLIFIANLF